MSERPFLGLRTCMVHVPDLKAARDWYAEILGVEPYFDEPFYVGFSVGGYELGLHPNDAGLAPGGTVYVYWGVEDVEATHARLLDLGAKAHGLPQEVGEGIKVATVLDPWGNVFGFIRNPHFKVDA